MSNQLETRDLQERLDELTEIRDAVETAQDNLNEFLSNMGTESPEDSEEKEDGLREALETAKDEFAEVKKEFDELTELSEEVSEWHDGNQLIPVGDFEDYCKKLCEDIGDIPRNFPTYIEIDWSATADNLKADYWECNYQGETYLYRRS